MGMFDDLIPQEGSGGDARSQIGKPEELNFAEKLVSGVKLPDWMENIRGTQFGRLLQGAADAPIGAMALAANVLPDSTGIPQAVNKRVSDLERDYQTQRKARGDEGFDGARLVGNIASPANALLAEAMPAAAVTTLGRVAQGAAAGAASGATAPVTDNPASYWSEKAAQVGLGALTGGILGPALTKVAEVAIRKMGFGAKPNVRASVHDTDNAIVEAMKETGQNIQEIPSDQLAALRQQVGTALQSGQKIDPAAALRRADFEALGMEPTLGQITREPMQFAREQALRGVEGVGEPLSARLAAQGQQLQSRLPQANAKNAYQAGTQLSESLAGVDDKLRRHVSGLYTEARNSAGKDLDIPLQGFAQDYADVLHRFGDKLPSGVRNVLGDYGLGGGTQTKVFNFEEADRVLKALNANRSNDPATNTALGELRGALRRTLESVDASGGPFSPAVKAASERFRMHDAIPALKAAADGSATPDTFVRQFIVNGKTNEVKGLAQVLKQADPDAFQEARAQIADELRRAAFGEVNSVTGDSPFSPARYMRTIRTLGVDKLQAFFSPEEVSDILRVGRVGSYIKSAPNASAVNTSNTAGAAFNLLAKVPGISPVVGLVNRGVNAVQNNATVRSALAAEVPVGPAPLNDAQRNWLAYILAGGALGAGGAVQ